MFSGTEAQILQKLDEWEQREGELPSFIQLCFELLRIQARAKTQFASSKANFADSIILHAVVDRLASGAPLLTFKDFIFDWEQVKAVFQEVTVVVAKDSLEPLGEIENLKSIASSSPLFQRMVRLWYQGSSLARITQGHGIHAEVLSFVVQAALKPFLSFHSEVLLPKVEQEHWRRRYCPICGGSPDFAFLDKERGARWLLCYRCDAEWLFQRLECPYCGTQNPDALAYFSDDEGLYRLYICEECRSYIKAIDLRRTESEILLPLERVLTIEMDEQGRDKGYKAGGTAITPFASSS